MKITQVLLDKAITQGILTDRQAKKLWVLVQENEVVVFVSYF